DLVQEFGAQPAKVDVVPNPIDAARIRARGAEMVEYPFAGSGRCHLITVGRLSPEKGLDFLARSLAGVDRGAFDWVIVGDGPERGRIRSLVHEAGMEDRVHFAGMCENPWSLMRHADILVHPSRSEAFPNVFGEAFALGLPVIASDCSPGVREYLSDGACGILVPVGDEGLMAAAISALASDPETRQKLARAGLERVVELNPEASVANFEEILREAGNG
ncbi:MAG: glycosyltransferase, partial [Gemmatimonadetes bacterium]|nr:glycosyltransferase [Gemmatimonadota bacterium]